MYVAVLAQAAWAQASCCAQVFSGRIAMAEVDDIAEKSRQWGMVDMHDHLSFRAHASAAFWHSRITNASDSCTVSWIFPYPFKDREGILCMSGQEGGSTMQYASIAQGSDSRPDWLSYGCTFYERTYLDAVISKASDGIHLGRAEWFFDEKFNASGMATFWRSILAMGAMESVQSLLRLFHHLEIVSWKVFIARLSWRVYAGLDLWEYSYHKHELECTEWVVSKRDVESRRDVWWERIPTIVTANWSWCNEWTMYASKRYEKSGAGTAGYEDYAASISRIIQARPCDFAAVWKYEASTMRSGDEKEEESKYTCVWCEADGGEHCGHRLV